MTISRLRLRIGNGTDTGTKGDTGHAAYGLLSSLHWVPNSGSDTGGALSVSIPPAAGDTGGARTVLAAAVLTTGNRTWAPRQAQHGSDGAADPADTGAAFGVPIALAGERLRAIGLPGATIINGTLYAYIES